MRYMEHNAEEALPVMSYLVRRRKLVRVQPSAPHFPAGGTEQRLLSAAVQVRLLPGKPRHSRLGRNCFRKAGS